MYSVSRLKWDSEFFGCRAAKVKILHVLDDDKSNKLSEEIKDFDFITISNTNSISNNNYISRFKNTNLIDVAVNFSLQIDTSDLNKYSNTICKANLDYTDFIVELAAYSFSNSRFYKDIRIGNEKASKVFINWVVNSFNTNKRFVFTEEKNGFLLFNLTNHQAEIELIAVDVTQREKKIGKSLITGLLAFCVENDVKMINVSTQLDNFAAMNFYISCGFKFNSTEYIYHTWNKEV